MGLKTRVDTHQVEFGEHGIIEVETTYNFDKDNMFNINVKSDTDDGYFRNTATISGSLIYTLISMLQTAAEQLAELDGVNGLDKVND